MILEGWKLKTLFKLLIVVVIVALVGIVVRPFIFKSEETGPVYVEAVSEDGLLKLTMMLEKTKFTTSPREPVRINLTLTNVGDQDITLTFHYRSKFDVKIFDVNQGEDTFRWSYEHIEGPPSWCVDVTRWEGEPLTLETPEISLVTLRPGDGISQLIIWDQHSAGEATQMFPPTKPVPCAKGPYRVWGYAGFSSWFGYERLDNPLRYFQYEALNGTLVSVVLETPGVDVSLV